ncbi:MAG: TIGR02594 family protein [Bradyrhizobium sp.]|nr:TIGR02594 family protein [Bradyrhizobium sp.]
MTMVRIAFCQPHLALALLAAAIAASVSPASARPYRGISHHSHAYHHIGHHAHQYGARQGRAAAPMQGAGFADSYSAVAPDASTTASPVRYQSRREYRRIARSSRWERSVAEVQTRGVASSYASVVPNTGGVTYEASAASGSSLVSEARRYIGGNPTGRGSLWCARFMNMVLQQTGHRGTGSDMANSFASYGTRVSGPQVGAIAVMSRGRRGGHVGIITGVDASGNPIMISGNNGNRVREAPVSRGRIYAYVMPN